MKKVRLYLSRIDSSCLLHFLIKIIPILVVSLLTFQSCKNPTAPENIQPGRRDYTWTVDTVVSPTNYPYKTLYRLWASSPSDVWTTAIGGDFAKDIFHFDGSSWTAGGKYNITYQPHSIYGFGPNDVYIGCVYGRIYRYDGSSLKEVAVLTKDGHSDIVLDNMWGESGNDLFAFGAYSDENGLANGSVIAHYVNNQWTILNADGLNGIVEHLYKNNMDNNIYMQVIKWSNTYDSTFIYEYNQGKFIQLYKTILSKNWANISLINGEVYFILNTKIARKAIGQFQTILDLGNTNFYYNIWGRNSKDIFLEMTDGLAHYNGSGIEYLFHYNQSNVSIFGAALFQNDVFFLVYEYTTGLSLIYHGKLNMEG